MCTPNNTPVGFGGGLQDLDLVYQRLSFGRGHVASSSRNQGGCDSAFLSKREEDESVLILERQAIKTILLNFRKPVGCFSQ